jgi:hypothetical protein
MQIALSAEWPKGTFGLDLSRTPGKPRDPGDVPLMPRNLINDYIDDLRSTQTQGSDFLPL